MVPFHEVLEDSSSIEVRAPRPLVSCIMPTANRRRFIPLALRGWLRQDYAERELIIVDDGADPIREFVPDDPRIRYLRLEPRQTIGAKRNLACQAARGELIAHWDDDDWYAPHRLRYQVDALLARRGDICGLTRLNYHEPSTGRSWRYVYQAGLPPWAACNTLCYTRLAWRRRPFPDVDIAEVTHFLGGEHSRRVVALEDGTFFVGMIHGANVSPKRPQPPWWHPMPTEEFRSLMGGDLDLYRDLPEVTR